MGKLAGIVAAVGSLLGGCGGSYVGPERLDRGLVIVLPGIEGRGPMSWAMCRGLNAGGVDYAIELHDWTVLGAPTFLINLRAEKRNRREAAKIASRIVEYQQTYPGRLVFIVGNSGGGAMAVWIAEAMPEGCELDGLILLAPALSPGYPLDAALSRTRRGIASFHSRWDWFFAGLGTIVCGTSDGRHTSSAGRVGFRVPTAGDRGETYRKLLQIPWRREMWAQGHLGGHTTSSAAPYVAKYVAPLLRTDTWDRTVE